MRNVLEGGDSALLELGNLSVAGDALGSCAPWGHGLPDPGGDLAWRQFSHLGGQGREVESMELASRPPPCMAL